MVDNHDESVSELLLAPFTHDKLTDLDSRLRKLHDQLSKTDSPDLDKLPQRDLTHQQWLIEALTEYFSPKWDKGYFPDNWTNDDIKTHLRTATEHALAANGSSLWSLRGRWRDPYSKALTHFCLNGAQFQIAARIQLGAGLHGLLDENYPNQTCACRKQNSQLLDKGAFHALYSCHKLQPSRSNRHRAVQTVYEIAAKLAGLTVQTQAPNVTNNNTRDLYKKEFADWTIHDPTVGSAIVFDNHIPGIFTQQARRLCRSKGQNNLPRHGHSSLHLAAHNGRSHKYDTKGPGCESRDVPFLPLINTVTGAFVPLNKQLSEQFPISSLQTNVQRVFGDQSDSTIGFSGKRPRSIEEALIRRWARRAADQSTGKGIFDKTLSLSRAAGSLTAHFYRRIAHAAIRHSTLGVISCLKSCGLIVRG